MYEGEVRRCYSMQRPTTSANIVEWELLFKFVPGDVYVQYQAASADQSMRSENKLMFSHEGSEAECPEQLQQPAHTQTGRVVQS